MLLLETPHWRVELSDDQTYLGRCVVIARRPAPSLSELTDEEWLDFAAVARKLESAAQTAFGATLCNWSCLLNLAYRDSPPRPHVHWHFRPRYREPARFAGELWVDTEFGSHYARTRRAVSVQTIVQIGEALKRALQS